jgi:hypothetical protein
MKDFINVVLLKLKKFPIIFVFKGLLFLRVKITKISELILRRALWITNISYK